MIILLNPKRYQRRTKKDKIRTKDQRDIAKRDQRKTNKEHKRDQRGTRGGPKMDQKGTKEGSKRDQNLPVNLTRAFTFLNMNMFCWWCCNKGKSISKERERKKPVVHRAAIV